MILLKGEMKLVERLWYPETKFWRQFQGVTALADVLNIDVRETNSAERKAE